MIVYTVAALTIERYFCLRKNVIIENDRSKSRAILFYNIFLWTLAILFALPKTLSICVLTEKNLSYCHSSFNKEFEKAYTIFKCIAAFAFPYLLIMIFSILLLKFLKDWSKKSQLLHGSTFPRSVTHDKEEEMSDLVKRCDTKKSSPKLLNKKYKLKFKCTCNTLSFNVGCRTKSLLEPKPQCRITRIKRKTTRFVLAIVISFLCCWSPLWIFQIINIFYPKIFVSVWLHVMMNLYIILVYLGGVINPLLYILLTENFKNFVSKNFSKRTVSQVNHSTKN